MLLSLHAYSLLHSLIPSCVQLCSAGTKAVSHYYLTVSLLDWISLMQLEMSCFVDIHRSPALSLNRVEVE